jgi:hypothetical protein
MTPQIEVFYSYSPLREGEIRLLTLSSRLSGLLSMSIEAVALTENNGPYYEALSYVFGST